MNNNKNEGLEVLVVGSKLTVAFAKDAAGRMHAKVYMESEIEGRDAIKLFRIFQKLAEAGRITNDKQFKKELGPIWGAKSFQARVACFQHGNVWFLTHGFNKKQDKWPTQEIERALRIMVEHLARKPK